MTIDLSSVDFQVYNEPDLEIDITAKGKNLAFFAQNAVDLPEDDELIMPDVVALLIQLINLGMFVSSQTLADTSHDASLVTSKYDPVEFRQHWRLRIKDSDSGIFRVLTNLLLARDLDSLSIRSVGARKDKVVSFARMPPLDIPYPQRLVSLPFDLEQSSPDRMGADRCLQIQFLQSPDDELLEDIYSILESWTNLLLLGGYPPEAIHPMDSLTIPDLPFLLDDYTVEQVFQEAFVCDEAAFNPIINWCVQLNNKISIAKVSIE